MTAFRERTVAAQDGLRLYFRDYGDPDATALPVLCLTGLTRNSRDYHRLATRLAPHRRVICPDYRGRGRSERDADPRNYNPTVYLADIRHLLAATGLHRVIVVGTSLGGLLATGMAVAMPTALAGVVLNDVGPELDTGGLGRILEYIRIDRTHRNWDDAVTDLRTLMPNLGLQSPDEWREVAAGTWREEADGLLHFDWDVRIAVPLLGGAPVPDLWPLFRALRNIPTLALRGERSDVLTEETFRAMARENPWLRAVTVPHAGHTPTLGEPVSIAAMDEFLADLSAGRPPAGLTEPSPASGAADAA